MANKKRECVYIVQGWDRHTESGKPACVLAGVYTDENEAESRCKELSKILGGRVIETPLDCALSMEF